MRIFFVCLLAVTLLSSCTSSTEKTETVAIDSTAQDTAAVVPAAPPPVLIYKDTLLDNLARFVAGLPQLDSNSFSALESDHYWQEYKTAMDNNWKKMYETRLSKITGWRDNTLALHNDTLPLFYPFSGPDFLHAYYLYPNARTYVLAALEPVAAVPQLDTLPLTDRDKFLDTLGASLRDIFQKSYFITKHMKSDLKQVKGVLPPLYFFIQRSGHEFISQAFITLDSTGIETEVDVKKLHWQKTPGVKLVIRNLATREIKTLYYFSVSISNSGLAERPELVTFITQRAPFNTFVKSASYLMHNKYFTGIKNLVLAHTENLFQDDTGIPYKDFKKNLGFTVQFYGEYVKPVKDFGDARYQPDLDSAFKASTTRQKLPFSLGYHWGTAKQHYILVRKSKVQSVQ
ncbi:MAG: hypothetical protein KIT62_08035 [Cyclobacteriaceae bacterium]|nr:hypothetical protein [Cyclobacteriaceae bacterium]